MLGSTNIVAFVPTKDAENSFHGQSLTHFR